VVVKNLLASGREIGTRRRSTYNDKTAGEQGRALGKKSREPYESEHEYRRTITNFPHQEVLQDHLAAAL